MKQQIYTSFLFLGTAFIFAGCDTPKPDRQHTPPVYQPISRQPERREITLTPQPIAGTPRSVNNEMTGGYAPSHVQAQLKIDVKEGTREVKVIRDNTDPYVITKPYILKHADPYAVRSYLEAAVGAKSVVASPAQVTAVKYTDGTGVVLVSAEAYRFQDSDDGRGIDNIIQTLDRDGLTYLPDADAHVYFPRLSRASNLRDMILKVGSSELDPQFTVAPGAVLVDGGLNALIVKAPQWNWEEILAMLKKYDRQIPEIKISYRVLEIYAENDDRIGVDFQSWKNNEGIDLFSAGTVVRRNWGTFFTSGVQPSGHNRTGYWNFNPKWNTRYLDFMTSIGKAKCLAEGVLVAQNRKTSNIQVNSGFFYDRTYYTAGATSIPEACREFTYTDPNPDTILRESMAKMMPTGSLTDSYNQAGMTDYQTAYAQAYQAALMQGKTAAEAAAFATATCQQLMAQGKLYYLAGAGYTMRTMGTQTGTELMHDAIAKLGGDTATSALSKWLTGYVAADGTSTRAAYYNTDWNAVNSAPGVIHGWLQYPMPTDGFRFDLKVTPVVTGKAAQLTFDLNSISLLGWNSDGSARTSKSGNKTTVQISYGSEDFIIGGLRKSEAVRGTAGLPYLKDLPIIGRLFSTETESIKQSQLVLIAHVEYSEPDAPLGSEVREDIGKIVKGVNTGMKSRFGNMLFQQLWLDPEREDRLEQLDEIGNRYDDEYKEIR